MKKDNKIISEEKKKKNSLFDFLVHKIDDDQFGKQEVSKEKKRNQIIVLTITIIFFVICVIGAGVLIWLTKEKIASSSSQSSDFIHNFEYVKNSFLLFLNKLN